MVIMAISGTTILSLKIKQFLKKKRKENSNREYVIVLNGYTSDDLVMLSGVYRTLQELFNYYEYYDNYTSEWKPFGVEE